MLETKRFKSRMTNEVVVGARYKGKQAQAYDLLMWVVDNNGRAQGQMGANKEFVLQVFEENVGMVNVKPGDTVVKSESGFEVYPIVPFSQMFIKLPPILKVTNIPTVHEAIQFTGGPENETDITDWLNLTGVPSSFRHATDDKPAHFRIEFPSGSIDIPMNNWIVKIDSDILFFDPKDFFGRFQEAE